MKSAHCSRSVCVPTAPGVCALGWVKCREHISLLVGMHRNYNSWPEAEQNETLAYFAIFFTIA